MIARTALRLGSAPDAGWSRPDRSNTRARRWGEAAALIPNVQSSDAVDLIGEQAYIPRAVVERVLDQAAHGLSDAARVGEHAGRAVLSTAMSRPSEAARG